MAVDGDMGGNVYGDANGAGDDIMDEEQDGNVDVDEDGAGTMVANGDTDNEGGVMKTAIVTGAAGFIGSHMVSHLRLLGYFVRAVDIKEGPLFGWPHNEAPNEYRRLDLRDRSAAEAVFANLYADEIYHFAADMGGIGYITHDLATITRNNALINLNMFEAARVHDFRGKFFFSSSACVYPAQLQAESDSPNRDLREYDAWPADPEAGYGLEKLFAEELLRYYAEQYDMDVRIARYHNIYGPQGTYEGGREKAPAALVRKALKALEALDDYGVVEVWGDGAQTRSFLYIDDCVALTHRFVQVESPTTVINIGSDEVVTIAKLAEMAWKAVLEVAKPRTPPELSLSFVEGPQGVRGRNCDQTLMLKTLRPLKPVVDLATGLRWLAKWMWEVHGCL